MYDALLYVPVCTYLKVRPPTAREPTGGAPPAPGGVGKLSLRDSRARRAEDEDEDREYNTNTLHIPYIGKKRRRRLLQHYLRPNSGSGRGGRREKQDEEEAERLTLTVTEAGDGTADACAVDEDKGGRRPQARRKRLKRRLSSPRRETPGRTSPCCPLSTTTVLDKTGAVTHE